MQWLIDIIYGKILDQLRTYPLTSGSMTAIQHKIFSPIAIHPVDDETVWYSNLAVDQADTVNYICGAANKKSVKLSLIDSAYAVGWMDYDYGSSQDFRDADTSAPFVRVRFYVHAGSGDSSYEKIKYIWFFLGDNGLANHFVSQLGSYLWLKPGWHTVILTPSKWGTSGSPAWNAIRDVRFKLEAYATSDTPSVTLDYIEFFPRLSKPLYMFTMDDNKEEAYEVAAYLSSKGMAGTFYTVPSWVGLSGRLTLSQLQWMHSAGHLVANHSWSHKYWNDTPDDEFFEDLAKASEWLCDNGFSSGSRILALPGGRTHWKAEGESTLLGRYFDQIRLTAVEFGSSNKAWSWYRPDLLTTCCFDSVDDADTNLAVALADYSIAIVGFHHKEIGGTFTQAELEAHIDSVAAQRDAGNLEVITAADLLDERRFW